MLMGFATIEINLIILYFWNFQMVFCPMACHQYAHSHWSFHWIPRYLHLVHIHVPHSGLRLPCHPAPGRRHYPPILVSITFSFAFQLASQAELS